MNNTNYMLTGLNVGVITSNINGSKSRQAIRRLIFFLMCGDDSFLIAFTRFLVLVSLRWLWKWAINRSTVLLLFYKWMILNKWNSDYPWSNVYNQTALLQEQVSVLKRFTEISKLFSFAFALHQVHLKWGSRLLKSHNCHWNSWVFSFLQVYKNHFF